MSSSLLISALLLLFSAGLIYLACEYFVNGVEWAGRKAGIAETAVGSILAAFGTALPESVVTLIAVVTGKDEASRNIGVGAALGGPLVLATIAYAVVGITLLATQPQMARQPIAFNRQRLGRDQRWFLALFVLKVALGFLVFSLKPWLGLVFLAAYAAYFWVEMKAPPDASETEDLEPLKFRPNQAEPTLNWALLQTLLALAVIFAASHLFVTQLGTVATGLGVSPVLMALLLSPVATELPETLNAIIWIRQGKHRLALANISGAMMIQATIPTSLGLFFTSWRFDAPLGLAAVATLASITGLYVLVRRGALTPLRLAGFAGFYIAFAVSLIAWLG